MTDFPKSRHFQGVKRGKFTLFLTNVFTLNSGPISQTLGMAGLPFETFSVASPLVHPVHVHIHRLSVYSLNIMPPLFRPQYFQASYYSCDLSRPWDSKFSTWRLIFAFAIVVFLESRIRNSSSSTSLKAHCSITSRSKSEQYSLFLVLDSCLIHIQVSYHRNQRCIIFAWTLLLWVP